MIDSISSGSISTPPHVEPAPIGIRPRWLHDEQRARELIEAMTRYRAANTWPPSECAEELAELLYRIETRGTETSP